VGIIACFIDESGNQDVFAMGCVISTEDKWLRFDREWTRALAEFRVPYLHMRELVPRPKGPYAGWSREESDALLKKLVWVFKNHIIAWCGVTIDVKAYYAHVSTDKHAKKRNPYSHAFQSCISSVLIYCQTFKLPGAIGIVLDGGKIPPVHAAGYFEAFKTIKEIPNNAQLGVLLIGDDKKNNALQAADLLAHEVYKHAAGYTRRSFSSLCELRHSILNWDEKNIIEIAQKFKPIPQE